MIMGRSVLLVVLLGCARARGQGENQTSTTVVGATMPTAGTNATTRTTAASTPPFSAANTTAATAQARAATAASAVSSVAGATAKQVSVGLQMATIMRSAGYLPRELYVAGYSVENLLGAGYDVIEIANAGFTDEQLSAHSVFTPEVLQASETARLATTTSRAAATQPTIAGTARNNVVSDKEDGSGRQLVMIVGFTLLGILVVVVGGYIAFSLKEGAAERERPPRLNAEEVRRRMDNLERLGPADVYSNAVADPNMTSPYLDVHDQPESVSLDPRLSTTYQDTLSRGGTLNRKPPTTYNIVIPKATDAPAQNTSC